MCFSLNAKDGWNKFLKIPTIASCLDIFLNKDNETQISLSNIELKL
jgi:hypothetical protein